MIGKVLCAASHRLERDVGTARAHAPVGNVAVFDGGDGVLRVAPGKVVHDHLAVGSELRCDGLGKPP